MPRFPIWPRRRALLALLAALWAGAAGAAVPTLPSVPSPQEDNAIEQRVADALYWADLPALLALHDELVSPSAVGSSGYWQRMPLLEEAIDRVLGDDNANDAMAAQHLALTARWVREHPQQPLVHALHLKALVAQAWRIRGGGYANTVPPRAWDEFRRLLEQAAQHAARHPEASQGSPLSYSVLLSVGRGLDWPIARMDALLAQGLQRHPHAAALHVAGMLYRLPKWGGSALDTHRYIEEVARSHRLGEHASADMVYARLYSIATRQEFGHRLFEDTAADWARIQRGYRAMLPRSRDPRDRERLAYLACLAGDKATFLEFESAAATPPRWPQWGENPQRTLDTCRSWAARQ